MTPAEAADELLAILVGNATTMAADLRALNAFQRVLFVSWACRLADPSGHFAPTVKPHFAAPMKANPGAGDCRRVLEFRAAVDRIVAVHVCRPERLAIAKAVLESVGYAIANEDSILAPTAREKSPLPPRMDEDDPGEDEALSLAA